MAIKTNKSVKLTQEELQQLTELRTKTSELTFLRGQIGIAEDNIKRQLNDIKQLEVEQKTLIPEGINFREIKGLSNESIDILTQYKPSTIRQASLIPGFTSSALFLLLHYLKNNRIKSA